MLTQLSKFCIIVKHSEEAYLTTDHQWMLKNTGNRQRKNPLTLSCSICKTCFMPWRIIRRAKEALALRSLCHQLENQIFCSIMTIIMTHMSLWIGWLIVYTRMPKKRIHNWRQVLFKNCLKALCKIYLLVFIVKQQIRGKNHFSI